MIRRGNQLPNGVQHGQTRGLIDIDLIDARGINGGDGPGNATFTNEEIQLFSALGGKEFRIAQTSNAACDIVVRVKDDRRSYYGTEERSAADFIDSGDELCTGSPCALFKFQGATEFFQKTQFGGRG